MTKDQIFEFFRRLAEDNPSPETELEYGNAYQLVVAVALSAQATDVGVNKATRALFREVETPAQMLALTHPLEPVELARVADGGLELLQRLLATLGDAKLVHRLLAGRVRRLAPRLVLCHPAGPLPRRVPTRAGRASLVGRHK